MAKITNKIGMMAIMLLIAVVTIGKQATAGNLGLQGQQIDAMNYSSTNAMIAANWSNYYAVGIMQANFTGIIPINSSVNGSISINVNPNQAAFTSNAFNSIRIDKIFNNNLNLSNAQNFYFWFYVQNASKEIALYQGNAGEAINLFLITNSTNVSECLLNSSTVHDSWTPLVIAKSVCIGNANWNSISQVGFRINLNNALAQNVTVNIADFGYNYTGGVFGKAQVVLTFDGSWDSTILNATPILLANHQTAVAYIVTNQINQSFGTITAEQEIQLSQAGWDVASHTVNHANLVGETADDYSNGINNTYELNASQLMLTANDPYSTPYILAYPNGAWNNTVIGEVKAANYITARGVADLGIDQPNIYTGEPYNVSYEVQSVGMSPLVNISRLEGWINQTEQQKGLLVLTFHVIKDNTTVIEPNGICTSNKCYDITNFTLISEYLADQQAQGSLQVTNFSAYFCKLNASYCNPNTVNVTSTTTIPQSSGIGTVTYSTGNGGSAGFAGAGSEEPTIIATSTGYTVDNLTQDGSFNITLCGSKLGVVDNFITPTGTGLTINNTEYGLNNGTAIQLAGLTNGCNVQLLNISYVPYLHTVQLGFSNVAPPVQSTTATTTASTTSTSQTTTQASTTPTIIPPTNTTINPGGAAITANSTADSKAGKTDWTGILVAVIAVVIIALGWYLARPKQENNNKPGL